MKDVLYRYHDSVYAALLDEHDNPDGPGRVVVSLETYKILRTTPKGVWVECFGKDKFVLLAAQKRFACPTKKEALESLLARKKKQISILSDKIRNAESAMAVVCKIAKKEGIDLDSSHDTWASKVMTQFRTGAVVN